MSFFGKFLSPFLALAATLVPAGALANEPVTDCPLADARYSADAPLFDLLIDPAARRAVEQAGLLAKLPPALAKDEAPSFATIISLRMVAKAFAFDAGELEKLDRSLAGLPISRDQRLKRCARYSGDNDEPLPVPAGGAAVLVFERSNGFRDAPSVEAAEASFRDIAARRGWTFVFTSDPGDITAANLAQFKAVIWNNVSGDVLTLGQRAALRSFVEGGGGFAAVHGSGGDPLYIWDWYADTLIGARFIGHVDEHQTARIRIEDSASPITAGLSADWTMLEEWYSFARSPRGPGTTVLLTLDEASYAPVSALRDLRMGDHPIAWTRCVGRGRSFYTAIGHRPETYRDPDNLRFMEQALAWTVGLVPSGCAPQPTTGEKQ